MIFNTHEFVLGNMICDSCFVREFSVELTPSCIPQGCVYLKMDTLKSALGAYKALHGGWYKGEGCPASFPVHQLWVGWGTGN